MNFTPVVASQWLCEHKDGNLLTVSELFIPARSVNQLRALRCMAVVVVSPLLAEPSPVEVVAPAAAAPVKLTPPPLEV